jgi:lipoate-protein ligase A
MTGLKLLDWTCATPAENLACDEALLDLCETTGGAEILRFWEAREPFVVLGYANKAELEVDTQACRRRGIPILRRCSGGGAIVQLPGCLNYSLVLNFERTPALQSIAEANCSIMQRNRDAVSAVLGEAVATKGTTDLTLGELKFSGNSQRRKRRCLLFHGTFLLNCDLNLIQECLHAPSKEPKYRQQRAHKEFLTNLNVEAPALKAEVAKAWGATTELDMSLAIRIQELVDQKYSRDEWNLKW